MNADGAGLANLTRNEATDDRAPAWSPNGTEIAFSSDGGEAHARDVFAINVVTRALRNLTNGAGANYDPAWSPDGQKIAFASERWDDDAGAYDDHYEIYVRRRSTRVAKLTRNVADDVRPVWSASGARIAFNSRRDGNWETYAMNADGSVQRNLSDHAADDEDPAWSQTGGRSPSSATGAGALQPMYSSWTPMAGPSGSSRATRAISRGLCGRRTAERSPSSIGETERSTL
jgi:TolB protein